MRTEETLKTTPKDIDMVTPSCVGKYQHAPVRTLVSKVDLSTDVAGSRAMENTGRSGIYTLAGGAEPTSHRGDGATHRWDTISIAARKRRKPTGRKPAKLKVTDPTETGRTNKRIRVSEKKKKKSDQNRDDHTQLNLNPAWSVLNWYKCSDIFSFPCHQIL